MTDREIRPRSGTADALEARAAERTLVEQAQAGDPQAFASLYSTHVGRVYALCLRMVGDRQRAEDLTQDAFVRAWQKIGQFRYQSLFSSWLHRLTVNLVLGRGRSRTRRLAKVQPVEDLEAVEAVRALPVVPTVVGTGVDLERAIAALPPRARQVFVLHDVEGFKHEEIARIGSMAVGTSKAHLHRARRSLRELLAGASTLPHPERNERRP